MTQRDGARCARHEKEGWQKAQPSKVCSAGRPHAAGSTLTAREREVLDLVSVGLTNGEIAQRMWIAPGTVRRHLENIYDKLDVHTRTAAVWVASSRDTPRRDGAYGRRTLTAPGKERHLKRLAIVAVLVAGVVGAPAVVAADSGGGGATGPYAHAGTVDSPLGTLYGPVRAGDSSSTSYGYLGK